MIGTSNALIDNNANPKQRNVAFGKNLIEMRSMNSLPSMQVAAGSKNFNDQILAEFSQNLLKGFEKQRGYSVPNLGFCCHYSMLIFCYAIHTYLRFCFHLDDKHTCKNVKYLLLLAAICFVCC